MAVYSTSDGVYVGWEEDGAEHVVILSMHAACVLLPHLVKGLGVEARTIRTHANGRELGWRIEKDGYGRGNVATFYVK